MNVRPHILSAFWTDCPNCGALVPGKEAHVDYQIDCRTDEFFVPVKRVVDNQEVELWPDDYVCQENLSKYESLLSAGVFDLERELKG